MNNYLPSTEINQAGETMHQWMTQLYPICRSITGDGLRSTLEFVSKIIPLEITEIPTGTKVFDWTVPKEWNIQDAWVKNEAGEKVIDFKKHNLHILNYSIPIHEKMSLEKLKLHIFSMPAYPEWIPYRTSYYAENWGFCIPHNDLEKLDQGEYEVCVDATLEDGQLTYGELYLPGETKDEVLISCHSCHPSLCNDNLSGIVLSTFLAKLLSSFERKLSYHIIFIPGTIGSITWLARNEAKIDNIKHGLVIATVGDSGHMHYKMTRQGGADIDRAVIHVLKHSGDHFETREFSPYGYDERQYSSPGFNLPVGSLTRTPHGQFDEYHTSQDNLDFVQPQFLADSLDKYLSVIEVLEGNQTYLNKYPKGEPQLGKRGLYGAFGGRVDERKFEMAMLWVLNFSDGNNSLLNIAERANLPFHFIRDAADKLLIADLLERI
ncbi:MAG: DUF4910 domain-containing protein [Anaerolineae bacterium]|nr:DUF4910 domain-containing protein [Anaerolineae bacterium]